MRINFKQLCEEYNVTHEIKISQRAFARYLVSIGKYKTLASAIGMIQYNSNGKAQGLDTVLLDEASKYFGIMDKNKLITE